MMKKILFLFFVFYCQTIVSQNLKSGIYRIDDKVDTLFFKSISKPIALENWGFKKTIERKKFQPLIDEKYKAKYAVLVSKKPKDGFIYNSFLMLNSVIPESNVNYSDTIVRKYYDMSFAMSTKNKKDVSFTGNNIFFSLSYDLQNFAGEYQIDIERRKNINVYSSYEPEIFGVKGNSFYLKNSSFKIYRDTMISHRDPKILIDSGFVRDLCKYSTVQQVGLFKLKEERNYLDILPIQKSIVFYSNNEKLTLNPGDFLATTKETKEWFYGDFINIDGSYKSGKIYKEDLLPTYKIMNKKLHGLDLKIMYTIFSESERQSWAGEIHKIKIYNKKRKSIQILDNPGIINDSLKIVNFIDVNFDGYKDLEIYSHSGGAGPNDGNNYYIFNPKTKKFDFNQELSECMQTQIDSERKVITSSYRDGADIHGMSTYKWIKGVLTEIEFYKYQYLDEDRIKETHLFLRNGKMRGKTKIVKAPK